MPVLQKPRDLAVDVSYAVVNVEAPFLAVPVHADASVAAVIPELIGEAAADDLRELVCAL